MLRTAALALRLRRALALENLALHNQLGVLKRQVKKPRFEDRDRILCMTRHRGCSQPGRIGWSAR